MGIKKKVLLEKIINLANVIVNQNKHIDQLREDVINLRREIKNGK